MDAAPALMIEDGRGQTMNLQPWTKSCFWRLRESDYLKLYPPLQIIEALDADCIDESEVLTCADELHHIDKRAFTIPFVCGAKDLGEAMRRIGEGAAMIRGPTQTKKMAWFFAFRIIVWDFMLTQLFTHLWCSLSEEGVWSQNSSNHFLKEKYSSQKKCIELPSRLKGNAGTGNVLHAVRHARKVTSDWSHKAAKESLRTFKIRWSFFSRRCSPRYEHSRACARTSSSFSPRNTR